MTQEEIDKLIEEMQECDQVMTDWINEPTTKKESLYCDCEEPAIKVCNVLFQEYLFCTKCKKEKIRT